MLCPKCKTENSDSAKFCKTCGAPLNSKTMSHKNVINSFSSDEINNKNKKILIAILAIVVVSLAGAFIFSSGILGSNEIPLETQNFEIFKIDAPVGSKFIEYTSMPSYANIGGFILLENVGNYSQEVFMLGVSTLEFSLPPSNFALVDGEGDIKIYENSSVNLYLVERTIDGYTFSLMGNNLDLLKKMINSVEITDKNALAKQSSSQSTSNNNPTSSSNPTSSPLTIQGGSFSTGSGLSDKTEASIYVGSEHAGEKVTIQIYYSRDGNSLNNGNMVQKTVDSSGYIHVNSADSYKYYPDYATVNVYDSNGNLQDSVSVNLSPTSGTQTF